MPPWRNNARIAPSSKTINASAWSAGEFRNRVDLIGTIEYLHILRT